MRKKTQKQRQKTRSKRIGTVSNSPTLYSYYFFIFDMRPRREINCVYVGRKSKFFTTDSAIFRYAICKNKSYKVFNF